MSYPKELKAFLLCRLMPGFDGVVDATRDEVVWRDQRAQPTEKQLSDEYAAYLAESETKKTEKAEIEAEFKQIDAESIRTSAEAIAYIKALHRLLASRGII